MTYNFYFLLLNFVDQTTQDDMISQASSSQGVGNIILEIPAGWVNTGANLADGNDEDLSATDQQVPVLVTIEKGVFFNPNY